MNQWIEKELEYWFKYGNREYVNKIENHLLKALNYTYNEEFSNNFRILDFDSLADNSSLYFQLI